MVNSEYLQALTEWREAVAEYEKAMLEVRAEPTGEKRAYLLIARHRLRDAGTALEGLDLNLRTGE